MTDQTDLEVPPSRPVELIGALVAARAELGTVDKARTADAGSYEYAYAGLDDLVAATTPVLAAHGLAALTPVHEHADGVRLAVTVTLYHVCGEELRFDPLPFPAGRDPQSTGSAITYYRRFALLAALGMAAGEAAQTADQDDDGRAGAAVDPLPAARKRLGRKVHGLDEGRRVALRAWLIAEQLPDKPSAMDADQLARTNAWIDDGAT